VWDPVAWNPNWNSAIGFQDATDTGGFTHAYSQCECDLGWSPDISASNSFQTCSLPSATPQIACGSGSKTVNGITYRVPYRCDATTMQCNQRDGIGCACKSGYIASSQTTCVENIAVNVVIGRNTSFVQSGQAVSAICDVPKTGTTGFMRCRYGSGNSLSICSNHGSQDLFYTPGLGPIQLGGANYPYTLCVCDIGWDGQGCDVCSAGYVTVSGRCVPCGPGTFYGSTGGAGSCSACPVGTFSPATGVAICPLCVIGTYQNTTGSTSCMQCVTGRADGDSSCLCLSCGSNSVCVADGSCRCNDGFIKSTLTTCRATGTPAPSDTSSSSSLSAGATAGIAIGAMAVGLMLLFAIKRYALHRTPTQTKTGGRGRGRG